PPTVNVSATYPGASAKVVADTVAAPIEQEVNGVENMLYMLSKSTNDGQMNLDVTFRVGTNLDFAQVLTQNRVSIAEAKLPEEVKRQGVTVKKKSPMILLCVNLLSPDGRYDQLYLSNYATIQVKDALARLPGVGDVSFLGARDYSMRIWLDPTALASRSMTASDVLKALREQNVQVAAGRIGQPPAPVGVDFQYTVNTLGRLLDPDQFADIVVKTGERGDITRLADRDLLRHGLAGLLAEQPVALRPGARHRHRRRRRDRRGRERRALDGEGPAAARGDDQGARGDHGPGDRDHPRAELGLHPDGVHRGDQWPVLPAVRTHHRGLDHHLGDQRDDDGAGASRHPDQAART